MGIYPAKRDRSKPEAPQRFGLLGRPIGLLDAILAVGSSRWKTSSVQSNPAPCSNESLTPLVKLDGRRGHFGHFTWVKKYPITAYGCDLAVAPRTHMGDDD